MADRSESTATLRIFGELLVPSEISGLLGAEPTAFHAKGDVLVGRSKDGGPRIAKQGMWRFEAGRHEPADVNKQVCEILGRLTQDLGAWNRLGPALELDMFCGYFMSEGNEVLSLPATTLGALAERRIELVLDVYQPPSD